MGGYRITTYLNGMRVEGEWGLNLPTRNLFHEALADAGCFVSLDAAITGSACDPENQCRGCPLSDGYVFAGEAFRAAMRQMTEWLWQHPGWNDSCHSRWLGDSTSWHVALTMFTGLAELPGDRIVFHDDLLMEAGNCPEGAPYLNYPRRPSDLPAFLRNLLTRKRNMLVWALGDVRYFLRRLFLRPRVQPDDEFPF